ncbi:hypothetical protein Tco_1505661 [Tanacetum coccineum]
MMSMAWGDGDGGVDGVAVAVVGVATKTRGGEWLRPFALISIRSLLMFYLPLLESNLQDSANVSLHDLVDEHQDVDYVAPLKMAVKEILIETSQSLPCAKANRGMPLYIYFVRVTRTTFRGKILGYAASWLVQVGIECYRYVHDISKSNQVDDINVDAKHEERAKLLRKRVYYVTVRCCSSLISASDHCNTFPPIVWSIHR